MRKLLLATLLVGFALPALAQTQGSGPASCKDTEMWDQATQTCKPRS
jgi:hypothetical protein